MTTLDQLEYLIYFKSLYLFPKGGLLFGQQQINDGATSGNQCVVQEHSTWDQSGPGLAPPTFEFVHQ